MRRLAIMINKLIIKSHVMFRTNTSENHVVNYAMVIGLRRLSRLFSGFA